MVKKKNKLPFQNQCDNSQETLFINLLGEHLILLKSKYGKIPKYIVKDIKNLLRSKKLR